YAPRDGTLAVTEIVLKSDRPFRSVTGIEPWMLQLVRGFGQGLTARAVYEAARGAGQLPEGFGPDDFATLVAMMVERGYLEVDEAVLQGVGWCSRGVAGSLSAVRAVPGGECMLQITTV